MGASRPALADSLLSGRVTRRILLNYAVHNPAVGYFQGMSDLVAPILAEVRDESDTFWCFVGLMQNTLFVSSPRDEDMEKQLVRPRDEGWVRRGRARRPRPCCQRSWAAWGVAAVVNRRKKRGVGIANGDWRLSPTPWEEPLRSLRPRMPAACCRPHPMPPAGPLEGPPASPHVALQPRLPGGAVSKGRPTTPGPVLSKVGPQVQLGCSLQGSNTGYRNGRGSWGLLGSCHAPPQATSLPCSAQPARPFLMASPHRHRPAALNVGLEGGGQAELVRGGPGALTRQSRQHLCVPDTCRAPGGEHWAVVLAV